MNTTTRQPYTGPRTRFTYPDGVYYFVVTIPWSDLPEGNRECPALKHGMLRVMEALGRETLEGMTGWASRGAGVSFEAAADSDEAAVEIFRQVSEAVGSVCGKAAYMQPTELGMTTKGQEIARF